MTRRRKQEPVESSFQAALDKAWDAFNSPENQARVSEREKVEEKRKRRNEVDSRRKKLRRWGVPKVAAGLIARDKLERVRLAMSKTEEFFAIHPSPRLLLILAGNPGCGKTVAASSRIEDRKTGCFVRAAELVELGNHYSDREVLSRYRKCGVLVLDDLGVEYRDERMICRLDELLDSRAAAGLPTIITTNLPADDFRLRYQARIWSRIHQFGDYIELDDPDFRVTPIGHGRKR